MYVAIASQMYVGIASQMYVGIASQMYVGIASQARPIRLNFCVDTHRVKNIQTKIKISKFFYQFFSPGNAGPFS